MSSRYQKMLEDQLFTVGEELSAHFFRLGRGEDPCRFVKFLNEAGQNCLKQALVLALHMQGYVTHLEIIYFLHELTFTTRPKEYILDRTHIDYCVSEEITALTLYETFDLMHKKLFETGIFCDSATLIVFLENLVRQKTYQQLSDWQLAACLIKFYGGIFELDKKQRFLEQVKLNKSLQERIQNAFHSLSQVLPNQKSLWEFLLSLVTTELNNLSVFPNINITKQPYL